MNWDALGAIAELIGALAVVVTLIFLAIQLRRGASSIEESNRLERASAIGRHNDSISRWRGRLIENKETAQLWDKARKDDSLDEVEQLQVHNLFVDLVNTQRANFVRAKAVGEDGLSKLAVIAISTEFRDSENLLRHWENMKPFLELVSSEFVNAINHELAVYEKDGTSRFQTMPDYPGYESTIKSVE